MRPPRHLPSLLLLLCLASFASGQETGERETSGEPRLGKATVTRVVGKSELGPGTVFTAGSEVDSGGAVVEVVFDREGESPGSGSRLSLGKKGRLRFTGSDGGLVLEKGEVVVSSEDALSFRAGDVEITLEGGEAIVERSQGGALEVFSLGATGGLVIGGARFSLPPGHSQRSAPAVTGRSPSWRGWRRSARRETCRWEAAKSSDKLAGLARVAQW